MADSGPIAQSPFKMLRVENSAVRNFRRCAKLVREHGVSPAYGAVEAYEHPAPTIDSDTLMKWLMELVHGKGATFTTDTIRGDLFSQEHQLWDRFAADAIVNTTRLTGAEIPACYPIRGALIRVVNDNKDFDKVEASRTISADGVHDSNEIVFSADPRLAGYSANEKALWGLHSAPSQCPSGPGISSCSGPTPLSTVQCEGSESCSNMPAVLASAPRTAASYAPMDRGGAGWSLLFGCAEDVAGLVEMALLDFPAEPMQCPIDFPTAQL